MWKRKSKRSKVNKKSPFGEFVKKVIFKLFIVVFLICIIVIGGIKLVYFLLSNMSCFRLSEVYVKNHITLTGKDAFEFTRLNPGINIFALEISALAKEISRRHPEYEDVVVKRIVPNTLIVLLKERTPIVQIKMVKFYPVDKNGFIIPYGKDIPYDNLPIVMGIDPAEISLNSFSNSLRIKKAIELMDLLARGDFPWRKNIAKI
ncbi:MAG: cell division protein FtsQ/DivIB, partial [Candidatus Omnitrophota bacterium]